MAGKIYLRIFKSTYLGENLQQHFIFHVTQGVKVENKWEFVNLKLKIFFCFILNV